MNLIVNMLINWEEPQTNIADGPSYLRVERILWIDSFMTEIIVINVFSLKANPVRRLYQEVAQAIVLEEARVVESDPYQNLLIPENKIIEKYKRYRDEVWQLLAPIIEHEPPELLLNPWKRSEMIKDLSNQSGRSTVTIRKHLRRWWQTGRVKNAFLPHFEKCGARGKSRKTTNQANSKLGRPSALSKAIGQQIGIRITDDIERRFERGIKRFYEKPEQLSLKDAFKLTLQTFFHEGFSIINGTPVPILPPASKLPSFNQFRYWYETAHRKSQRERKSRHGEREYNLRYRALLGDSTQMAFGPGSLYQIDATIADIYLVNSLDRTKIIGRPVVYFCIDVFSRVITGFCITLEGPSWMGAMLALDNVMTDKVIFCSEFGITIQESDWPCHHLPEGILADRGEFEGYDANSIVNSLGVCIHNTSPYRADEKGIIERNFRTYNEKVVRFLPGYVPRQMTRGGPDYVLDATLTLNEFRKLIIFYVLDHNLNRYLKSYKKDVFMIADHVERFPLEIWNWGISNRSGYLRSVPQEIARLNLLPRKEVSVTPSGIYFEGELYYMCDLALREGWFEQARIRGNWKVEIAFDPRTVDYMYLPINGGTQMEICYLISASKHLSGRDLHEAKDYFALEKLAEESAISSTQQSEAQLQAQKTQIVSEATEKTRASLAAVGNLSKSARKRGIKKNRSQERQSEREHDAWRLGITNMEETSRGTVPIVNQSSASQDTSKEEYVPPSPKASQIRNIRDKNWKSNETG